MGFLLKRILGFMEIIGFVFKIIVFLDWYVLIVKFVKL